MSDWIGMLIESGGYAGIFLLMVLENVFPPIPSEVIMLSAGVAAAGGHLNLLGAVCSGAAGSLVGLSLWYAAARAFGEERLKALSDRFGRWMTLTRGDIDRGSEWFRRFGTPAVFFGRVVPTIRTLISIPAGIVRMPLPTFLLYSGLGSLIWIGGLASVGYVFGSHFAELTERYLGLVSNGVIVLLVVLYLYRVATFKQQE